LVFAKAQPPGNAKVEFIPFKRSGKRDPEMKALGFFQGEAADKSFN
jgi:hypothetical protein